MYHQACVFHVILQRISSSFHGPAWPCPLKEQGVVGVGGGLLNGQRWWKLSVKHGEIYLLTIPKGYKSHINFHIHLHHGCPPIQQFFLNSLPPIKTNASPWGSSHLKMNPPIWKTIPPSFKRESPFHEMIPRKSTINSNLKSN